MAQFKTKKIKCMNLKPEASKWADWAPEGGCRVEGEVGDNVEKWLCPDCTMRTTTERGRIRKKDELEG